MPLAKNSGEDARTILPSQAGKETIGQGGLNCGLWGRADVSSRPEHINQSLSLIFLIGKIKRQMYLLYGIIVLIKRVYFCQVLNTVPRYSKHSINIYKKAQLEYDLIFPCKKLERHSEAQEAELPQDT